MGACFHGAQLCWTCPWHQHKSVTTKGTKRNNTTTQEVGSKHLMEEVCSCRPLVCVWHGCRRCLWSRKLYRKSGQRRLGQGSQGKSSSSPVNRWNVRSAKALSPVLPVRRPKREPRFRRWVPFRSSPVAAALLFLWIYVGLDKRRSSRYGQSKRTGFHVMRCTTTVL